MELMGRGHRRAVIVAALVAALGLAGCSGSGAKFVKPGASGTGTPGFTLGVTPAQNATDVPVSVEIAKADPAAKLGAVALTDGAGKEVTGKLRDDGSSWVPDE